MRIIVFGAGGFVGGWICEELAGSARFNVLACVRKWSSATRIARRGVDITQCDLESSEDLPSLLASADIVVNASMPPPDREPELAARLYFACVEAGVRRFIQFSSAAVYGERTGEVNEDVAPASTGAYGRGKALMEARLLKMATENEPQLFILRPSIIYGPFSEAWTIRYAQRITKGRWRSLGPAGAGTCNLVHAQDVARSVFAAATADTAAGAHVLNINGPELVSWNAYIERFGNALGITDRFTPNYISFTAAAVASETVRVGGSWAKAHFNSLFAAISQSAGAGRVLMGRAKSFGNLYPSTEEMHLLRREVRYSWDRATRELGFHPSVSLDEGLRKSVEWCRIHGIV